MARTKGSKNKNSVVLPDVCALSPEQRLELLANLIVDRILDDLESDQKLLKRIKNQEPHHDGKVTTT